MRRIQSWLAAAMVTVGGCGGAQTAGKGPVAPARVLLVQIDGLSAALLEAYLARPATRSEDRALHRWLGVGAAGSAPRYRRALGAHTALAPLPALGRVTAASLLTGEPPRVHGVRDEDDALAAEVRTLFERLPKGAEGIAVGDWQARGAEETIKAQSDGARAKAAAKALRDARLVTLRMEGLAEAQARRGPSAGADALAAVDRQLALALPKLPPDVLLVLVGGNAASEQPAKPNSKGAADFAQLLELPAASLHGGGGVLRADALTAAQAAKLDEVPFTQLVLLNADGEIKRWDADLGDVRPLTGFDAPNAPELAARAADALRPGEWLALASRPQGFDFAIDGRPLGAGFVGGPDASESQVALLFAGAGVDETLGRDLGAVPLSAVAPTILAALGGDISGLPGKSLVAALANAAGPDTVYIPDPRTASRARTAADLDASAPKLAAWLRSAPPGVGVRFSDAPEAAVPEDAADWLTAPTAAPDAARAALIATSLGASVAVLADRAVTAAPFIAGLGGPDRIEAVLGADPAANVARVRAWSDALAALESGLFPAARAHLAAAAGLPEPYEGWRLLLDRWALSQDPDDTEIETLAKPTDPWLARLDWLLGVESKRARDDVPPILASLTPAQRNIENAAGLLQPLTAMEALCNPPDRQAADRAAEAMTLYVKAGLIGHAALASASEANAHTDPVRAASARAAALLLLDQPGARWAAVDATSNMLGTANMGRLVGRPVNDPNLVKAQRVWLLELQRRIVADDGPGADDRNVKRVATLLFNTIDPTDPLLRETLGLALGAERTRAGAVMGSLLFQGALASVFGGQALPRIAAAIELMRQTLGPWAETPVAELKPAQRAARAILPLTESLFFVLRGDMANAAERLAAAESVLTPQLVLDLRDASRDGTDTLAQWSPALLGTIYLAQAIQSAVTGDKGAARRKADALIDLGQAVAEREVRFHKRQADLGPKVAAVGAVVRATVALVFDGRDDAPNTELVQKITAALQTLDLRVPAGATPDDATEARVLTIIGVLAHDTAWLLANLQPAGASPPDASALKAADEALATLAERWHPEGPFGRAALLLGTALQRALPAAPALFADEKTDWVVGLSRLKAVSDGLFALKADLDKAWPLDERTRGITEEGRLSALLLDLFRSALDADLTRLASDKNLDGVVSVLDRRADLLLKAIGDKTGNAATPLLALLRAWLGEYQHEPDAAASFAELAAARAEGTELAAGRWLLWAHAARWRLMGNDPAGATRNLDKAVEICAGAAPYLDQLRAHLQIDRNAANKLLDRARGQMAARGLGPARFTLVVVANDGDTEAKLNLDLDLKGLLLGGTGGSFQMGAGWNSNSGKDPVGARIEIAPDGSSLDYVVDALTLQAWDDLRANDVAATDRSLTRLADALFNQPDAGWFGDKPGPSLSGKPTANLTLRNPIQVLWVASLAHAQGHEAASARLFGLIGELLPSDLQNAREGAYDRCPEDVVPALAAIPEDKQLSRETVCNLPRPLWRSLPPAAATVVADLAHWHARQMDGLKPDPKQLAAALKAGVKYGIVPAWRAGTGKKPKDFQTFDTLFDAKAKDPKAVLPAVLAGPLRCQALWPLVTQMGATGTLIAETAEACSAGHARLVRMEEMSGPKALSHMVDLARFVATTRRVPDAALMETIGRSLHLAAQTEPQLAAEQTAALAKVLATVGVDGAAFELDAMALAARIRAGQPTGNIDPLLALAVGGQLGTPAARKLVKAVAFRPGEAPDLAKAFYRTP